MSNIYSTQSNIMIGPVAVIIGANRHKIPSSPYKSKNNTLPVDMVTDQASAYFPITVTGPDNNPMNLVDMKVVYVVRKTLYNDEYVEIDCSVLNPDLGQVQVYMPSKVIDFPGLYLAALQIYNLDGTLIYQAPRQLEVTYNVTTTKFRPVTIAEIRMSLRDFPEYNNLLNDVEFSDNEIAYCLNKPVELWNETPPDLGYYFSVSDFPFRQAHIAATIGYLLNVAGHHYIRNQLAYSSGGLSVDDKNKGPMYLQLAEQEQQKFRMFIDQKKLELNINGGFLFSPGPLSSIHGYYI